MNATLRSPPAVVPTLTHVVAEGSRVATPPPQPPLGESSNVVATRRAASSAPSVDELTDRIMAHVMPHLQASISQALRTWWIAHEAAAARAIEDAVRDDIADRVRAVVADALIRTPPD